MGNSSKLFWMSWQTFSKGKNTVCGAKVKVSCQTKAKDSQIVCCEDIHGYGGVGWSYNMIGKGALITWICSMYICPSSWSCWWGNRDE